MENSCHCMPNQHSDTVAGPETLKCAQFCTDCTHADFQLNITLNFSSQLWLNHEFLSSWGKNVSNFSELLHIIEIWRCEVSVGFSHLLHKKILGNFQKCAQLLTYKSLCTDSIYLLSNLGRTKLHWKVKEIQKLFNFFCYFWVHDKCWRTVWLSLRAGFNLPTLQCNISYSNVNNGPVNTKMVKKEFVLTRKEKVLCQYT